MGEEVFADGLGFGSGLSGVAQDWCAGRWWERASEGGVVGVLPLQGRERGE